MKSILAVLLLVVGIHAGAGSGSAVGNSLPIDNTSRYCQLEKSCLSVSAASNATIKGYFGTVLVAQNDIGQCMGNCASEQGMCMGQCQGDGQCISTCAATHGRCVARCY